MTCKVTIRIKDYFPKVDTIPYENYICLFTCGEYEDQIPFLPDDTKIIQHQIKNITSDIKYKVHILDYNDMSLIGMCEMTISYKIINQISPPNGFIQEQQKKLLIDLKTKRKLFGTIVNLGDIYLNIYAEVFLISRTAIDQKNIKKTKNIYQNTPQCYIKYNFQLNKSDYSPKSSKNKSSLINNNSENHTLNNSKQDKCFSNKHSNSNYNMISYKNDKGVFEDSNKNSYYTSINSSTKKGFRNYSSRLQQKKYTNNYNLLKEQNKKTIMDLLQQKKMMENKNEKDNSEKDTKSENIINNKDNNSIINSNKEGFLTEQNFNSNYGIDNIGNKYIINNHRIKKQNKEEYKMNNNNKNYNINNNINNDIYNNNNNNNENITQNVKDKILSDKKTLSPYINKNNYETLGLNNNLSKTVKNSNNLLENVNEKYVYKSKKKLVKMGKAFSKNKFNKFNISKSNKEINSNNINENQNQNQNDNSNCIKTINNINTTNLSTYSGDDDYLDIDRIILKKGAELRNEFHFQLKQQKYKNNNINNSNNSNKFIINSKEEMSQTNSEIQKSNDYNNNNYKNFGGTIGGTHYKIDTPRTDKISQYSSAPSMNYTLTQENVKNNCLKLIEFYSLLNFKLKKINPKNNEIKHKLLIFKELFSNELKKSNQITDKSNVNSFLYNLSTNINVSINELLLNIFPKMKKIESSIYQCLFDIYHTDEEIQKFKEYENYDEQTKIYLLLAVIKNLINKYGNISQIFIDNVAKQNSLRQCLANYDLIEKEEGDKDFVNLEELSNEIQLKNEKENKELNDEMDNKFKVIKEVDEDKEEENDEEEEEIKDDKKNNIIEDKKNENFEVDMMNDEEIIDKILVVEFRKKYKDNRYYFDKIGLNEYMYNDIKIRAIIDKDGDIKIIIEENNEEYYLDDFIKLFHDEEQDDNENNHNYIKNIKNKKRDINNLNDKNNNINSENDDININNKQDEQEDNKEEIKVED